MSASPVTPVSSPLDTPASGDVVAALEAAFRLPSAAPGRGEAGEDAGAVSGADAASRDAGSGTFVEQAALALFGLLALGSVVLVVIALVD